MFEAWSVAIRLRLIDGATHGLLGLSQQLLKAHGNAKALKGELESIKTGALVSGAMVGAGLGIFSAFRGAVHQAREFQQEFQKFQMYGMGDAVNSQALNFVKHLDIAGNTYVDVMRKMTEAQGIFRESGKLTAREQLEGAKVATPTLAKLAFIESSLGENERSRAHTQDLAMLRFIESRGGANNPGTFNTIADWGFKLSKSSGGVVPWSELQQFMSTSGAAGFNVAQDALTKLEPVIADLRGGRVGSGLRVSFQRLLGTQRGLPKQAVEEFLSLGLWDRSKVELNKQGGIAKFLGNPGEVMNDRERFATDPVAYYLQNFLPAITRKYGNQILGSDPKAMTERAAEISMVFGPGTAGAVFSQIDKLMPAIQRSIAAQGKEMNIGDAYKLMQSGLKGKELDLYAKWLNLQEQAGEVVLPLLVQGMDMLLPVLKAVSNVARDQPAIFRIAVSGILAVGAALTGGGVIVGLLTLVAALKFFTAATAGAEGAAATAGLMGGLGRTFGLLLSPVRLLLPAVSALIAPLAAVSAPVWITIGALVALGAAVASVAVNWDSNKSVFDNINFGMFKLFQSIRDGMATLPGMAGIMHDATVRAVKDLTPQERERWYKDHPNDRPKPPPPPKPPALPKIQTGPSFADRAKAASGGKSFWGMVGEGLGSAYHAVHAIRWTGAELKPGDKGYHPHPGEAPKPAQPRPAALKVVAVPSLPKPLPVPRVVVPERVPLKVPRLPTPITAARPVTPHVARHPWADPSLAARMNTNATTTTKALGDLASTTTALQAAQAGLGRVSTDFAAQMVRAIQQLRTIQLTSVTNLDGRQIAKTVTEHQAHAAGGPRATRRQDTSANMPAVFAPYVP